jgi:hypothetical protein
LEFPQIIKFRQEVHDILIISIKISFFTAHDCLTYK